MCGIDPLTGVEELQANKALIDRLEAIRTTVSATSDLSQKADVGEGDEGARSIPLLFAVARPPRIRGLQCHGEAKRSRRILLAFHGAAGLFRSHPGTGSIGTAVACGIEGTIAAEAFSAARSGEDPIPCASAIPAVT